MHHLAFQRFKNGEWFVQMPETVRRQHVFFFHPLQYPDPNAALMQLFLANDAMLRASAAGITLVTPYLPYLRQDRKHKPRVPISARLLADLIESNAQVERIITVDMHADQEQGFFSIPVDNLTSMGIFEKYLRSAFDGNMSSVVVVAPDIGGAVRARRFALQFPTSSVAIFEKRRPRPNESEVVSLIGEPVAGKVVILFDDIIDTGGTILGVVDELEKLGATQVIICATHGIFSSGAKERFSRRNLSVLCTDSIPRAKRYRTENAAWLTHLSMDELLADTVYEASLIGGSVSKLMS